MKLLNLMLACACAITLNACKAESNKSTQEKPAMTQNTITALQKIDTQVGTGREAEAGFNVTVHYTGWLLSLIHISEPTRPY